jgi:tetratricopeptide (TPR) repeat protein
MFGQLDDQKAAIVELDGWIAVHPMDDRTASALNGRCWARARLGQDLDKALTDCNAALKLDPGRPSYLDSRGLVRLRMGDLDGAINDYDAALKLSPNMAWSLYGRGLAELRRGAKDRGQADLAAAAKADPQIAEEAAKNGLAP